MARENLGAAPTATNDQVRKVDLDAKVPLSATVLTNSAIAYATSNLTLTTTPTDVPGATLTITTAVANTVVIVQVSADFNVANTTGTESAACVLNVDGTDDTQASALYKAQMAGTTAIRSTSAQFWRITLASAGSHTLKLRGLRTANTAGTMTIGAPNSCIAVLGRF